MTLDELVARTRQRLDLSDASPGYYQDQEIVAALNEGQRLFVLLTLCLEATGTVAVVSGTAFYRIFSTLGDYLCPLRVRVSGTGGAKLRPAKLHELAAMSPGWQGETATAPTHYAALGFDLFACWPSASKNLDVTYARCPAAMAGTAAPEIPEEHHHCLIEYAIPRLRVKEGAQMLARELPRMERFLEAAGQMAERVRARAVAHGWDRMPFELERFDKSRLVQMAIKGAVNNGR